MKITIYGAEGCPTCKGLREKTEAILQEENIDADVTKVSDVSQLAAKGIMSTPALAIDDEVVFTSTPSEEELKTAINERTT